MAGLGEVLERWIVDNREDRRQIRSDEGCGQVEIYEIGNKSNKSK